MLTLNVANLTLNMHTILVKTNSSAKITIPRITFNQVRKFETMTDTRKRGQIIFNLLQKNGSGLKNKLSRRFTTLENNQKNGMAKSR